MSTTEYINQLDRDQLIDCIRECEKRIRAFLLILQITLANNSNLFYTFH